MSQREGGGQMVGAFDEGRKFGGGMERKKKKNGAGVGVMQRLFYINIERVVIQASASFVSRTILS